MYKGYILARSHARAAPVLLANEAPRGRARLGALQQLGDLEVPGLTVR